MSEYENMNTQQPTNPAPVPTPVYDTTPISMWGYFGYQILFAIPCVGLICLIIFAFGGTKNLNLRNFARSYFCLFIVGLVLFVVMLLFGGLAALTSFSYGF